MLEVRGNGLSEKKKPLMKPRTDAEMDSIAHSLLWPLQAWRGYLVCKNCGRWVRDTICNKCSLKEVLKASAAPSGKEGDCEARS